MNLVPQERFELSKALLLRQVGVPVSISHRGMVVWEGFEPPRTSRPAGYSRVPCRIGVHTDWWARQDSNLYITSFEEVATADCATGPLDQRSRYRSRKVVWAVGFEPTTSRFQGEDSGLTELRPEMGGRGSVFMAGIVN